MNIIFVNNSNNSTLVLPTLLIRDMLSSCNIPVDYTVENIQITNAKLEGLRETYYVYYSLWEGKDIFKLSYSCDSQEIWDRIKPYVGVE
jgi:hypothetical protein